jgi:hypothetical protein
MDDQPVANFREPFNKRRCETQKST